MRDTVRTSRQNILESEHLRINKMYNFLHHFVMNCTIIRHFVVDILRDFFASFIIIQHIFVPHYYLLFYHFLSHLFISLVYLLTIFVYPHFSPPGGSYESICKKHIQSFMDGAEQYARYVRTPPTQHTHSDTHTLVVTHAILPLILLSSPLQGDTIVQARG